MPGPDNEEREPEPQAAGAGRDLRCRQSERCGADRGCGSADAFNARGPDGLIDGKAPGQRPKLVDAQRQPLAAIVENGATPSFHGVVRWRLSDLAQCLHAEFAVSLDETTVSLELKKLGYVKLTARPRHHAQDT